MSQTGFYESNDQTNSVKALKEDVQGLRFNMVSLTFHFNMVLL